MLAAYFPLGHKPKLPKLIPTRINVGVFPPPLQDRCEVLTAMSTSIEYLGLYAPSEGVFDGTRRMPDIEKVN